ncbi:MAG: hypothetical protein QOJ62_236, partial [Actinomycetota bacterium]|nr:hypothetical protein [Actinomycetota bacterium]
MAEAARTTPDDARQGDAPPLRVVLVLATSTGGVGRHVRALARGLSRHGLDVTVAGPRATNQRFGFDSHADDASRHSLVRFRAAEIASGLRPLADVRAALSLRREVRGADVVHAHGLRAGVVAAAAIGRWRRRRSGTDRPALVVTLHNALLGSTTHRAALGIVEGWLGRLCDVVLVVSPDLRTRLQRSGSRVSAGLVSSLLPPPSRSPAMMRDTLGVGSGQRLVLAVGRLHPQKGFDVLVHAASLVEEQFPGDTVFVVAGEGPARDELEQSIRSARVDVRLIGDRDDVPDLVSAADVVVMPSRWEGWPLTAAEVLGAGRPLVA